jgi:hypothetical protein
MNYLVMMYQLLFWRAATPSSARSRRRDCPPRGTAGSIELCPIRLYSAACSARCWKVSSLVMTRKDGCRTEKRELDGDGIADEKGEVTP